MTSYTEVDHERNEEGLGNLRFLPVISTCETCKTRVESMLDTI